MSAPAVSFNGIDWASTVPGLKIIISDPYRQPNRTVTTNPLARNNKSVTSSAFWTDKKLNVTVEIGQNTRELLDIAIDTFKSILNGLEKTILLNYGNGTRQWTGTVDNFTPSDVQGGHGTFDVEFELADPYGYDTATTALFAGRQTGNTRTDNFTVGGTAETQALIITITYNKVTAPTGPLTGFTLTNPATGQAITVNATGWVNGTVVVVDIRNKKVTSNGIEVGFTGPFPEWATGAGSMTYADTLTTRDFSISGLYTKRYQ